MSELIDGGYIRIFRKFQKNPIWMDKEPFDRRSAWIDILLEARWHLKPTVTVIDGHVITVQRGEVAYSYQTWAKRWGWTPSKVRRWFNQLEKLGQISKINERKTTRLIVCNYDTYQDPRHAGDTTGDYEPTTRRQPGDNQATPTEEGNKEKKGEEGEFSPALQTLFSKFKSVHTECERVTWEQFIAKFAANRFQYDGITYDPDVEAALEAFSMNCASMTTFRPSGVMLRWGNYLSFQVDRQLDELKKNTGRGKKLQRVSL